MVLIIITSLTFCFINDFLWTAFAIIPGKKYFSLLIVPQVRTFQSYCMSSTNLRSVIKGELLLNETVGNLATEKKNAKANLCRTVSNLKPSPSAKFS